MNQIKKINVLLFFVLVGLNCIAQSSKNISLVDKKTFATLLKSDKNAQLLDVRTPEEYAESHIEKSKNINWNGNDFVSNVEKLDKTKAVFVYCKVGGRSKQACEKLAELGFTEIYNLQGGIINWNKKE